MHQNHHTNNQHAQPAENIHPAQPLRRHVQAHQPNEQADRAKPRHRPGKNTAHQRGHIDEGMFLVGRPPRRENGGQGKHRDGIDRVRKKVEMKWLHNVPR